MGLRSLGRLWWFPVVLLLTALLGNVGAQSFPSFAPQSRPNLQSQPLSPFNPLGAPGSAYGPVGSDVIPLSSGMLRGLLPPIPNLELGFLYNIGGNVRSGRFYADYLYPLSLSGNSVLFGEAHYESQDFWKKPAGGSDYRQDLSLGGGLRRLFSDRSFLGVNAFYDGAKLFGKWYSSAGVGLEMAAITPGEGAIDLNVNWYGNLVNKSQLINAFRNRAGSWDIEAGVSQPLFDQALDLRLKAAGYNFNIGTAVYGWRAGADLTTRNGAFTVKYEHGQDRINGSYDTIGGYVNVGFQLDNVISGESPFVMPEPVFGSPRHLWRLLTQKVRRNWHQPTAIALERANSPLGDVWFRVDCQGLVSGGGFTGLPAIGGVATWNLPNNTPYTEYATYSINFEGDTAGLPPTVPVTVTWSNTGYNTSFYWGPSSTSNGVTTFNIPKNGGTIGNGGSVVDTNPYNRPAVYDNKDGVQGTVTFEAPGVRTLTITVWGPVPG